MARQETIEVKLAKSGNYTSTYNQLKSEAEDLERLYANLRIGSGSQSSNAQAAAARAAAQAQTAQANATAANLRVQREQVNLNNAQQRTLRDLAATQAEQTRLQREQTELATAGVRAQTAQTNQYNATVRTVRDLNDAQAANVRVQTEQINLQTAQVRLQNTIQSGNARQATALRNLGQILQNQVNPAQAQNIQYMTQWIHGQQNLAGATVTATGTIRNVIGTFQTYNAAMTEAGGVTHNFRIAVNQANGDVYQLDKGIKTTALSLTDLSVIFRAIRTVVGFTGVAQSFRQAFGEMKNMSDAMAEYRKVTGATAQEMETLRDTAYEVAKAYGESASGVISSAANMARAGYKENSLAMAELATRTKLVGDMTQEAADKFLIAVDAAYKYKGNVQQLSAVLDAANALDNQYATTIEKISDGMTLVASLASTAHVPVEQLMAALGTMTAVTQRSGAETARGLRSIILNVIGDTSTEIEEGVTATEESVKSMTDALIKYGDESVKAAAKAGKIINPMEAIVALQKAWKANQITEEDLYKISNDVAGKRYYNVFTALIQNPEMYNDMLQSIADSLGSAQSEIDILMDSWTRKTEVLKTTWTQLVNRSITEGFIKDMIDGATAALEFAGSLENVAISAGGALVAYRALSAGIGNWRTNTAFGGFNIGTSLLGLGIAGIGIWKAAYENNIRQIQQAASEAVERATDQTKKSKTLESIQEQYKEIAEDGIQEEQDELTKLKTLQDELNDLIGDQAKAIDIVNGKYGDTIVALKNLTAEQKKQALETQKAALVSAINAWTHSDFNGSAFGSENTMAGTGEALSREEFDRLGQLQYFALEGHYNESFFMNNKYLRFKNGKPTEEQDIIAAYEELLAYRNWLATEIGPNGKPYGQEHSAWYESIGKLLTEMEKSVPNIKAARELIDEYDKELESIGENGGSADSASGAIDDLTEYTYTLANAIDAATAAKEKFDDAMKTSKADAMNDYITAFKTLQEEIDAGRVNSTAYYAAARMLLGEEAYNATGGSTEAVMAALNKKTGTSGSILDAYKILTQTYVDENGKEIEGYGIYQLLSQTQGFNRNLRTAEGMAYIPDLTDEEWRQISKAWSGIDVGALIAVLNAFDQYDKKGYATDKNVQTGTIETKPEEEINKSAEAANEAAEAQNTLAEAEKQQAEAAQEAAEKNSEAVDAISGADKPSDSGEKETEIPKEVVPDTTQARKDAEEWLTLLTSIEEAYSRINTQTVGYSPDLEQLFEDIDKLREEITLNVKTGAGTGTAALMAGVLSAAISTIEGYAKNGTISVTLAGALTGNLKAGLAKIIDDAKTVEELKEIELILTGNPSQLDSDVDLAIGKEQLKKVVLGTEAETENAGKKIDGVADKKRTATINVSESGSAEVEKTLESLTKTRYVRIIEQHVTEDGTVRETFQTEDGTRHPSSSNKFATGIRSHPGGLSLVNDGSGPELIVDRGRAFIAGGGKPTILNLEKGAKVFTASETRDILNGSGVPAYAMGTPNDVFGGGGSALRPNTEPKSVTSGGVDPDKVKPSTDSGNGGSKKNSGGSSSPSYKFDDLKTLIDYIIDRIGRSLDEQLEILDKQIETLKLERQQKERADELAQKQQDLSDAMNNRTVRYIDENGQWHWMADQNKVTKAQDALDKYVEELAYNAQIEAIQAQKTALQDKYNEITKAWSDIQYGVNTPTGDLAKILENLIKNSSGATKKGAETVQSLLIDQLIQSGVYSGNYEEALSAIAKATAGNPVMPGESEATLASLIASASAMGTGTETESAMRMSDVSRLITSGYAGVTEGGTQINYNYFINGVQIGSDQASQPLSSVLKALAVHTESSVA